MCSEEGAVTDFAALLTALSKGAVEYILVGGVAATAHGSARLTQDVDIVYARHTENLSRLASALAPHDPYLREAPPGLPFRWSAETLRRGLNFTLTTTLGDIDLLGEITGGGSYENLLQDTIVLHIFGIECRCVTLRRLIILKRAAGRPRDLDAIAELEAILEEGDYA
jgi:predicted nucleotidyltransferase